MAAAELTAHALIAQHRPTLDQALEAIRTRAYWSPHPEHPKAYGENGSLDAAAGKAAFDAVLDTRLDLGQPGTDDWVGGEVSPYGVELGVTYPHADMDALLPAMKAGQRAWRDAGAEVRAVVCLEILKRISDRTHEFAHAVMHTSGQAFMMAFQAGGPHAQDRGLEAVAYAYAEQVRTPGTRGVEQAPGQARPARDDQERSRRSRAASPWSSAATPSRPGTATRACSPPWPPATRCWSSRTRARCCRSRSPWRSRARCSPRPASTRTWSRWPPNGPARASPRPSPPGPRSGSSTTPAPPPSATGWRRNARQAQVYTEKAGVNTVVVRLHRRLQGHARQPGVLAVPVQRPDVHHPAEPADPPRRHRAPTRARRPSTRSSPTSRAAVDGLLGDDARANALLGAIVNPDVKARLEAAAGPRRGRARLPRGGQPRVPRRAWCAPR